MRRATPDTSSPSTRSLWTAARHIARGGAAAFAAAALVVGCTPARSDSDAPPAAPEAAEQPVVAPDAPERPRVYSFVPQDAPPPYDVVLLLHPYGGRAESMMDFHAVRELAEENGWFVVAPSGAIDQRGRSFWNATDACCDRDGTDPDHFAFLRDVIERAIARPDTRDGRIVTAGGSNGGFMSYRLACDASDLVGGVFSIAGMEPLDPADCTPDQPVSIVHVHALDDAVINIEGAPVDPANSGRSSGYPSAEETAMRWARRNGCRASQTLEDTLFGGTATVTRWRSCAEGNSVTLARRDDGGHVLLPDAHLADALAALVAEVRRLEGAPPAGSADGDPPNGGSGAAAEAAQSGSGDPAESAD